jgi:hypothetical protein
MRGCQPRPNDNRRRRLAGLATILCVIALGGAANAAGVDSRSYSCAGLQALIVSQRYLFINNPDFEDTVVADASSCPSSGRLQVRSVPTTDRPECPVNYCIASGGGGGD